MESNDKKRVAFTGVAVPVLALLIAAHSPRTASVAFAAPDGKAIYTQKCGPCHHADGAGGGPFPALAGNKNVNAAVPTGVITTIKHGKGMMPAWKTQLSNADIAAVLTYVRTSWGNKGGPVTERQVAAIK